MRILNRFRFISSYLKGDVRMSHFPPSLEIEVTNRCNEDCVMCPRHLLERPFGNLSMSLLEKILDEIAGHVELVNLFHFGEPLLHPQLGQMIRRCKDKGLKVLVTTNGTLLTEKRAAELIDSGLDMLVISVDAASEAMYSKIRRLGNFSKVLSNTETFLLLKNRAGGKPYTQMQMVSMRINHEEIDQFINQWKHKADSVRVKRFYNTANIAGTIDEAVPKTESARPCLLLWREPVILYDGTVVPCCVDMIGEKPIGNVMEKSLMEIWNGDAITEMRRLHVEGRHHEIDLCRNCHVFQYKWPFVAGSLMFNDLTLRKVGASIESFEMARD